MRLHIIVLSLITAPINCNYPQFNANSDTNSTSTQAYKGERARNATIRLGDRRGGKWKYYNKLVKKLIKFVENLKQVDEQQCITDLTSLLTGASSVLAQSPFCALLSQQNCESDLPYWKLRVLDSWPRLPAGLTSKGPMFFLGDYDTCVKQWNEVIEKTENSTSERVHYCRTTTTANTEAGAITVTTGFCLPSSCQMNTVASLANRFSEEFLGIPGISENWISVDKTACHGKNDKRTERLLILFPIAITLILITGTSVDIFVINKRPSESHADDRTFSGSDVTAAMNAPRKVNWFNAPSVALTYKNVPDLSRTLAKPAIILDIMCSFSIRISLRQLCRNTAKEIPCLNGIKVISMLWVSRDVILGHSTLFTLPYMDNLPTFFPLLKNSRWLAPVLLNSSLAVDSFLFISGTVAAYSMRKRLLFRDARFSLYQLVYRLLMFYFHRILRIWPSMLAFTLFIRFIYNHLGDGPMWSYDGVFGTICSSKDVNAHLLFLSNWYPSNCTPWLWYTAVDFQLYLASPIILIPLWRCPRFALANGILLVIASIVYMIVIYAIYSLPSNIFADVLNEKSLESASTSFRLLYASPFARCAPFIVGVLTGWNVFVRTEKPPSVWTCILLKLLIALLLYFAIFAPFCEQGLLSYVHAILHRPLWSLALAILIWLSENGLAQEISYALSSRHFLLFTRLSFGVFLAHEPILLFFIWTSRQPHSPHSLAYFAIMTITTFVLALLVALLTAIVIEIPILSMEKKLFKTANQHLEDNVPDLQEEYTPLSQHYHYIERDLATKELSFYEKTTSWLRAPEFEGTALHASREPTVMECASSFSMDSLVFCKTAEHPNEWSREESLAEKFEKKAEESLLKQRPLDLEQWERSLYSSC